MAKRTRLLTARESEVLRFIQQHERETQSGITTALVAKHFGIHRQNAWRLVRALKNKGRLRAVENWMFEVTKPIQENVDAESVGAASP